MSTQAPQLARQPSVSPPRVVRNRVCRATLVMGALLAGLLFVAGSARAAFPGRDGLLAVQPLRGPGILLINANGRGGWRVCALPADPCGATSPTRLVRPQWAPDGGTLVINRTSADGFGVGGPFGVIYPDGSCLDCLESSFGEGADAAYTSSPTLLTQMTTVSPDGVIRDELIEYGVDGLERSVLLSGAASDPVWSSRGELGLVRDGWIWAGSPRTLRRVTHGTASSWSPDGRQIVFVRRGWLMIGPVRARSFRRLVRGAAPAWSPNGSWIAFFDKRHRLSLIRATGGRVRRVGEVTGWTVDWQPLPATPRAPCLTPSGSTVVATSDTALVTVAHEQLTYYPFLGSAYMGCLRADGRERLLASYPYPGYATESVVAASVAAPYAALAVNTANSHDQTMSSELDVFDLRTGLGIPNRGHEGSMCPIQSSPPCTSTIDQVVLGGDILSAVHTTVRDANCEPIQVPNCKDTVEQIQANDITGVHTLDSASEPDGSPAALTNLVLTGYTLTWDDNGTQHSAQLQQ